MAICLNEYIANKKQFRVIWKPILKSILQQFRVLCDHFLYIETQSIHIKRLFACMGTLNKHAKQLFVVWIRCVVVVWVVVQIAQAATQPI